ncbi:TetR/AcrR family transcriptional regulator [Kribbella sp. CA-293567]|uniref:TetR/AcrR family transcriptional regulator n=1 Tax=Kribbella sp. CA-293567 TaxID=3002436 RepID=UPI0022DE13AF|nr:TetR/AcrR family transcriptional regulator [Kribbella sp. CA-293567]WBQ04741.1 TetR/AcrR family transcriptional regulator [Kribbella sp. CA-293567]
MIRLSKDARREQLLDAALGVVRRRGADGLTLVTLAEAAGVSRPIVYDHFGTRAGLLLALYRQLDEHHRTALDKALAAADPTVAATARVMSTAYFACVTDLPESGALSAALKGNPETEAAQQALDAEYVGTMARALTPYSSLPLATLRLRCIGLLGAAEALAAELTSGRTTAADASAALTGLILGDLTD